MRTIAYIDGFNLYYRMLRERPDLKWVNPFALAKSLSNAQHDLLQVNYYTARLSARAHDPHAPARQATYLAALSSVPAITVHEGKFMVTEPWMPLAYPAQGRPAPYAWNLPAPDVVKVLKYEEKGSDVNLASHLVRDAFLDAFDVAVVLTNDSDLVEPIRVAVQTAGKRVGLLAPVNYPNKSLADAASFHLHIRPGHVRQSQFPAQIVLPDGVSISRPSTWS